MIFSKKNEKESLSFKERAAQKVIRLQKDKTLTMALFEKRIASKKQEVRDSFVGALKYDADEMEHHGFYASEYHNGMKETFARLKLGVSEEEALAVMVAYQLSTPKERKTFKEHILKGEVRSLFNARQISRKERAEAIESLCKTGQEVICQQSRFKSEITGHQEEPYQVIMQRFQNMPTNKRQKVRKILENSDKVAKSYDVNVALTEMTNDLLPLFFKELKNAEKGSTQDKIKEKKQQIGAFGFMFLTQSDWDKEETLKSIEVRKEHLRSKQMWARLAKSGYCCCDCY